MITFFDIPGRSEVPYSPNTWKVRLALNIKGIPYRTRYVEVADIESTCKCLGIPPSGKKPTGEPHYTFPAIIDDTVRDNVVKMSDSRPIIEYLDRTYPSGGDHAFFPPRTDIFQTEVQDIILTRILAQAPFLWVLDLYRVKTPRDRQNIKTRMEGKFGKPMDEILVCGEEWQRHWTEVRRAFSEIDRLAHQSANWRSNGPFLLGQRVLYADVVLCALLLCLKTSISDKEWSQIASWNRGRWTRFLDAFQPWIRAEDYQRWKD
ncbi:hypothetical protein AN958_02025 [Leucoagaricus sp. SymC.cos]|nr:hypothetical protein AN958_02025 [Leucoagaricus sp. SymC.cos]